MHKVVQYLKKQRIAIIGTIIGAVGGYLYWFFVGCSSGTCPITSSPLISTLYGALLGNLFGGIFKTRNNNNNNR